MFIGNIADGGQLISAGWRRVESSPTREARAALGEVIAIADDRFDSLVANANPIHTAWTHRLSQLS